MKPSPTASSVSNFLRLSSEKIIYFIFNLFNLNISAKMIRDNAVLFEKLECVEPEFRVHGIECWIFHLTSPLAVETKLSEQTPGGCLKS